MRALLVAAAEAVEVLSRQFSGVSRCEERRGLLGSSRVRQRDDVLERAQVGMFVSVGEGWAVPVGGDRRCSQGGSRWPPRWGVVTAVVRAKRTHP